MERGLVWTSVLNGRYAVTVTRTGADEGTLRVRVIGSGRMLHEEAVRLGFGAPFEPDVSDVAHWQEIAIGVVDRAAPDGAELQQPMTPT